VTSPLLNKKSEQLLSEDKMKLFSKSAKNSGAMTKSTQLKGNGKNE